MNFMKKTLTISFSFLLLLQTTFAAELPVLSTLSTESMIPVADFAKKIIGQAEDITTVYYESKIDPQLTLEESDGQNYLFGHPSGKCFQCGTFRTELVQTLIDNTKSFVIGGGNFNIMIREDVGAVQAESENCGATFQVASNFNCLEYMDNAKNYSKYGITIYHVDRTQGPAASISAAPGTFYRNYFVPHVVGVKIYHGQLEQQINLLDIFVGETLFGITIPSIPVSNGYIQMQESDLSKIQALLTDDHDKVMFNFYVNQVKVGIHEDIQVTSGLRMRDSKITVCQDPHQVVNQVFSAAINLSQSSGGQHAELLGHPGLELVARMLLTASYQGTIRAAAIKSQTSTLPGSNKVFLTMIGGGAFENQTSWIVDAIESCREIIERSGLEVYLMLYNGFEKFTDKDAETKLRTLVSDTGGTIK
jgi:hypothetical protein